MKLGMNLLMGILKFDNKPYMPKGSYMLDTSLNSIISDMGPSGPYGTLKTEYLQELAKNRQNHQKFQFQSCAATIYFGQFG